MSTYSPELRIELIANGTQAGVWGDTTNRNLGTLLEQAISGYQSVTTATQKYALVASNGAADEARNAVLKVNTVTTANFEIYIPPSSKTYIINNASAYNVTVYNSTVLGNTTAAGSGVVITAGTTLNVFTDGVNVSDVKVSGSSTNTANTVVQRDASGNFAANVITANSFSGNVTGNVTGNTSGSASSLANTGGWSVTPSGTKLYFSYNGVNVGSLDSSGNFIAKANVTAYGTP